MTNEQHEREIRAARNQALFRAVNEKLRELNHAFGELTATHVIACECADTSCVDTLEIAPADYDRIRAHPNRFAVLSGHVYFDVERVVAEEARYLVVENNPAGAELAEQLDPRDEAARR